MKKRKICIDNCQFSLIRGGRSDLSIPRLRRCADPADGRTCSASPPPSASTSAPFTPLRSNCAAPFRETCLRLAPPPRPERCPAPYLRRSGTRPFRRSSSPADCPPVRSRWSLARLGRLTFALRTCCRSLLRGSCLCLVPRLRQNPLRRSLPQMLRAAGSPPRPTFAPFSAPAYAAARPKLRSLPPTLRRLRIGTLAAQQPWRPATASASSSRAPSPSLPSHSCRKIFHSAARPCPARPASLGSAGSPALCFAVPPPAVPVPQAPPERSPARLFPPAQPFFPCATLHSPAPPCAGALQRPVSALGAGASCCIPHRSGKARSSPLPLRSAVCSLCLPVPVHGSFLWYSTFTHKERIPTTKPPLHYRKDGCCLCCICYPLPRSIVPI